jgi:hypothetical protein
MMGQGPPRIQGRGRGPGNQGRVWATGRTRPGWSRCPAGPGCGGGGWATRPARPTSPLVLGKGAPPAWPCRRVRWPDFGVPADRGDALDALGEAHRRALAGERVEVACRGGVGRTGTALAALAVLDGLHPGQAVAWVRGHYHRRAVETPWQRRWLHNLR